jgi:site-specific recombinase XerD
MDLYNFDKILNSTEKRIENASYSKRDKDILFDYEDDLFTEEDLSIARVTKYLSQLHRLRNWLDIDFQEATERDLKNLVGKIQRNSDLAVSTKKDYKICLRKFYRWLYSDGDPEILRWLTIKDKVGNSKLPEELLTQDEIYKLIDAANHPRDKAFIALLYDTGARIGEVGSLKLKHINFDKYGVRLMVDGKTGMRSVRGIFCVPYLSSWLAIHPYRDDPNSYLWIGVGSRGNGEPLAYASYRAILRRLTKRAGIKKRVYNHLFRHSRCTELAQHLTEAQLEGHAGWVQGSDMACIYVHLSGKQIDEAILKMHGLVKDEEESHISSKKCSRCGALNEVTNKLCKNCGLPFDIKDAIELGDKSEELSSKLIEIMEQDPNFKSVILDYLNAETD